jgi:hypothetical protein
LKTIEEDHSERMAEVARKIRLFLIWEQDDTYQRYILPHWGKFNIPTIISDQFWAIAYQWNKILPEDKQVHFKSEWMTANILEGHGALCSLYKAHVPGSHGLSGDTNFNPGDFRSEGDSPAFLHTIPTGLRNLESPDWGGWGGRYVKVRDNTWLDPVPEPGYRHPEGRWYTGSAWGRTYMKKTYPSNQDRMREYFKPLARWADVIQNDFAARADWCVKSFEDANHTPVPKLAHARDLTCAPGGTVTLSAAGSTDPDGDVLSYRWWQYHEADSVKARIEINSGNEQEASFVVPDEPGKQIHIILEVTDNGMPPLVGYRRIICHIDKYKTGDKND